MTEEKTLWRGSSSQVINLGTYILCGLLCWLIVPIFIALIKWWQNKCRIFEVTTQRIKITTGIFNKTTNELELYRVKDMTLVQPFWLRLYGLGNIVLMTHDVSSPVITLEAVPKPLELHEGLRNSVEECRTDKKVRLAELE